MLAVESISGFGQMAKLFESIMLVCFGASWPVSIVKTLRVRRVTGKSLIFLCLVFVGYLAGICTKFAIASATDEPVSSVVALYAINATMVGIDIGLYLKFIGRDGEPPATETA